MNILEHHDYPGNIRELRSIIQAAMNLAQGRPIRPRHLPEQLIKKNSRKRKDCQMDDQPVSTLARVEKEHILRTYRQTGHNKSKTARILGIGLNTLRRKLAAYNVKQPGL